MFRLYTAIGWLLTVLLLAPSGAAETKQARAVRVGDSPVQQMPLRTSLALADTCIVRHDSGMYWRIDGWVIGNELYKSYLDPAQSCPSPYPFAVTEVVMAMYFAQQTQIVVSVDVESVAEIQPGCPFPGNLVDLSTDYTLDIPQQGYYEIWVPLDSPYTVNSPFFAGFFIGNTFNSADSPAVITDDYPVECAAYNVWDD
ncbi:MAG: hypothetical protein AB1744_06205, partial [Candidatus Zixiibacteriota bacterium]